MQFWHLFNLRPGSLSPLALNGLIVVAISFAALVFFFGILKSRQKRNIYHRVWRRAYSFGITNLIIALALLFFTYELVPFLSARFWFILWGAGIVVWLFFIARELVKIPKVKEEIAKERAYKKYIP